MPRRPSPTLTDVARLAGVSVGTASKALNGQGSLRAETRSRVEAAARSLKFAPNMQARSLLAGKTGTVGLITDDLNGRFSLPVLAGAEDALGAGNLSVLLCDSRGDAIREQYHLKVLLGRRVDGIIMVGQSSDARESLGRDFPVPVVYAYSPSISPDDVSIITNDKASGRIALEHLVSLGRRRIAYIGGDPSYAAAHDRAAGGREALHALGSDFIQPPMLGAWTEEWGRSAVRALLQRDVGFDAIACGSDQIARGVLDELLSAYKRVPDEVAVIGHDNWKEFAAHSRPPLTSIDMNLSQVGSSATRALSAMWADEPVDRTQAVPARLVVRSTTAPPSGKAPPN